MVIDDVEENRFLLAKTLLRKFPGARIREYEEADAALAALIADPPALVVAHRSLDLDGLALVRAVRQAAPTLPIVAVSSRADWPESLSAGANEFLNYEAWLRIGVLAERLLASPSSSAGPLPPASSSASPLPVNSAPASLKPQPRISSSSFASPVRSSVPPAMPPGLDGPFG